MTAANHRRQHVLASLFADDLAKLLEIRNENISGLGHLDREGCIDHVAAGETKMQPATGRGADVFGDVCGEGDYIMVERFLQFLAAIDGERGLATHLLEILLRDDPLIDQRFGREQLDAKPNLELSL